MHELLAGMRDLLNRCPRKSCLTLCPKSPKMVHAKHHLNAPASRVGDSTAVNKMRSVEFVGGHADTNVLRIIGYMTSLPVHVVRLWT